MQDVASITKDNLNTSRNESISRNASTSDAGNPWVLSFACSTSNILKGEKFEIFVQLRNPITPREYADVSVLVTPVSTPSKVLCLDCFRDSTTLTADKTTILPLPDAAPGDAAPMKVYPPRFIESSIGQMTFYPGANNTITLTIMSNIEISPPAVLWISNNQTSEPVPFNDFNKTMQNMCNNTCNNDCTDACARLSPNRSTFMWCQYQCFQVPKQACWMSSCTHIFSLSESRAPGMRHVFSFDISNPSQMRSAAHFRVVLVTMEFVLSENASNADGGQAPFLTRSPGIDFASLTAATNFPVRL
jgi:hypothetical protein